MVEVLLPLFAYLLGSVTFGELIARAKGVNLREVGSGNVGATNVSRALGKRYGALVFFLDMLKGYLPTLLGVKLFGLDSWVVFFTGLFAVLGHMFPLFFRFRGGKGVATAFGVLLALSPKVALLSLLVWVLVVLKTRYVSLASLVSSLSALVFLLVFGYPQKVVLLALVLFSLILYKHRENVERLLAGREHKV
ncbi:MAG: glycerol-3-phosphate 1-O-acyltransferase PlsY [Aquificae bacterium]|nr:glycerol-3-phosphate 1-O-acyltransferase PlsY [Aquificota bacterium]